MADKQATKEVSQEEQRRRDQAVQEMRDQAAQQKLNDAYNKSVTYPTFKAGGAVHNASKRADGIAQKGRTKCKIC